MIFKEKEKVHAHSDIIYMHIYI